MKQTLRQKMLVLRDSIGEIERGEKSISIKERLFVLEEFKNAKCILCYANFRSEVETEALIKEALKSGKRILIPRISEGNMQLCEVCDFDKELCCNDIGIPEPKEEFVNEVSHEHVDLIIAPGVAFDKTGNRLGYGGGFYDRLLKTMENKVPIVALAFDIQIVDNLPEEEHDEKVDIIVSEKKIISL